MITKFKQYLILESIKIPSGKINENFYHSKNSIDKEGIVIWNDLDNDIKFDILSNARDKNEYLQTWNINTVKEYLDDDIDELKFNILKLDVEKLYKQLLKIGWGINKNILNELRSKIKKGIELDPIIVSGEEFIDGGHRLTAYHLEKKEKIPSIDISYMLNLDWEKYL